MKKVVENLVMVGDELHQLVEYRGEGDECDRCSLAEMCAAIECSKYGENGNPMYYERLGTLTELAKKKDERAMARHYIALLMQHHRWMRDTSLMVRPVDISEFGRAIDFAVNELKEKYKKL